MGSGVWARLGSAVTAKTAAVAVAGAVVVSGAVGAGVWALGHGPRPAVVQRSVSVSVAAGGEQSAVAACRSHEKALGGGYAITGTGFATSSLFAGDAWLAAAYNPDPAPATLTSYALCVNAKPEFLGGVGWSEQAHAFHDRANKVTATGGALIHDLTTAGPFAETARHASASPSCPGDFTSLGTEFRAGRTLTGRGVAPVPLDSLTTKSVFAGDAKAVPYAALNPGTRLSSGVFPLHSSENIVRQTRIEDPQPPEANYAVSLRPICVRLKDVSVATAKVTVAAGGTAGAAVACPKGKLVVGGGFQFPAENEQGAAEAPTRFFGDGWLYAPTDAPAAAGEPSGAEVKAWHVTGRNQQKAGLDYFDSVWIEHSDRETLTGNGYFDTHGRGPDDQALRVAPVPDGQSLVASAVCAKIDAKPTEAPKAPTPASVARPELPHALDPGPGATDGTGPASPSPSSSAPTPGASPTTGPSAPPGTTPAPGGPDSPGAPTKGGPSRPGTPSQSRPPTRQQPQAPSVSIQQPSSGGQLRRGCEESFAGSARTRPDDRPLTDPQYTSWRITGPNGPVTLGAGASGRFLVPLLPDGTYKLAFTATDPAAGLTGSAEISVRIVGCIR
ncbi:hypothetical protein [Streptomyces roseus]|uniref:Uncharacterized protein n=1 Tax=Streptomyces roseus TaxID=66430 RepID=A0A0J6XKF4_9ACTN|nr:hypothetical protein [Streptomyces roseus]KMO94732.1 hypothetical protein ACS04_27395 [Streptomyces roseus]